MAEEQYARVALVACRSEFVTGRQFSSRQVTSPTVSDLSIGYFARVWGQALRDLRGVLGD